ncbi:lipoprotein [Spiroplasma culicicola]|uniref:Lipoprotein n=1 Tax=Spiroplasma culicicola AES-1 TaxID=1276246 RepID=W6A768_9MOLU|nr:lipoprotein [Spiroplasma culicicola]AHI52988.1 hypothetical protein SCULI_v1c06470 [Spiroplasma culicicola AES-1]
MKKLLALLGAIGMTTVSATTVIACGNNDGTGIPPVEPIDREEVIKTFTEEVANIINNHIRTRQSYLTSLTDLEEESNFKFFNKTKIDLYQEESRPLTEDEKLEIHDDFNNVMAISDLQTEINNLSDKEEYTIILSNLSTPIFDNNIILSDFDISSNYKSEETDQIYLANISFNYEIKINYEKNTNENDTLNFKNNFLFGLTDSEIFNKGTKTMIENVQKDFLQESSEYSNIEFSSLSSPKTALADLTNEIKEFYDKETSSSFIKTFVKDNYFSDSELPSLPIEITGNEIVKEINWSNRYRENNKTITDTSNDFASFAEGTEIAKTLDLIFRWDMTSEEGQNYIDEYIQETYEDSEEYFNTQLTNFYEKNNINKENSTINSNSITQIGTIKIDGLVIKLSEGTYTYNLPSFEIVVGYSPDLSKERNADSLNELLSNNISKAISVFQATYGIDFSKRYDSMLGGFKDDGSLWDKWTWTNNAYNNKTVHTYVNLETPELLEYRSDILQEANQTIFNFSISGTKTGAYGIYKVNERIYPWNFTSGNRILPIIFEFDYFKILINIHMGSAALWQKLTILVK